MSLLDLDRAVVLTPGDSPRLVSRAATVLVEEVCKRTGIAWPVVEQWPGASRPVIVVGAAQSGFPFRIPAPPTPPGPEGYRVWVDPSRQMVGVVGADARGAFYGVGRLLRNLDLRRGMIRLDEALTISSAPRYPIRGHQLGYRPKNNTYDAWSPEQFDQYIRELALFGANSIEILPPRTDDEPASPLMPVPPLEMMRRLAEMIAGYGLDVWLWYPNMGDDYGDPACRRAELAERAAIFGQLCRVDAVFIPGGDPGHLEPAALFDWAAQVADLLRQHHPRAKIWLSPQASRTGQDWLDQFYAQVQQEPDWLGGIVFAPWVKTPLPELRRIIPRRYPIRRYPDITHSLTCQYPAPNWDVAYALTLCREPINPRPSDFKHIHNVFQDYAVGGITYSEGINDDLNKFVWADQDWDPERPVLETVRDYVRLFIGAEYETILTRGFFALEENWRGPLLVNDGVERTLALWQSVERDAPPELLGNYRFQMGLLRAYYDAYLRRRLLHETELTRQAIDRLRDAATIGASRALLDARTTLGRIQAEPVARTWRARCEALAGALFASVGAQLSVTRYGAISWSRGAFMDGIDIPLSDAPWWAFELERVAQLDDEGERLRAITALVDRPASKRGGIYLNLGASSGLPGVDPGVGWRDDPGYLASALVDFSMRAIARFHLDGPPPRLAWVTCASALYDTPLTLRFDHLPPGAYTLRVVYAHRWAEGMRLTANRRYTIHDHLERRDPPLYEFTIPAGVIRDGALELVWTAPGTRGVSVSELWLIPRLTKANETRLVAK